MGLREILLSQGIGAALTLGLSALVRHGQEPEVIPELPPVPEVPARPTSPVARAAHSPAPRREAGRSSLPAVAASPPAPMLAPTLATTSQTVELVRRNLAKELYRFELDLAGGLKIAGKGCDCGKKHSLGVEAITEELIPMDSRPVYGQVMDWLRQHAPEFEPTRVDQTPADYYRGLAAQVRDFRKEVLGTESRMAMLSPEEQEQVKARAQAMAAQTKKGASDG